MASVLADDNAEIDGLPSPLPPTFNFDSKLGTGVRPGQFNTLVPGAVCTVGTVREEFDEDGISFIFRVPEAMRNSVWF